MEAGIVDAYDGNAFPGNFDFYLRIVQNRYPSILQAGFQFRIFRNPRFVVAGNVIAWSNLRRFFGKSQRNRKIGLLRVDQISCYRDHIWLRFPQHLQKTLVSVAKLCIVQI